MMTSFFFAQEERVTTLNILPMVKAESLVCAINSTSGSVLASVRVKCEYKQLQNNQVRGLLGG